MDIEIDGMPVGRIVIGLFAVSSQLNSRFGEAAPLATENFRGLCTGEYYASPRNKKVLTYKGTRFHRIIPGFIAQGVFVCDMVCEKLGSCWIKYLWKGV